MSLSSFAQVGIGTLTPDSTAMLDIVSSTKGFLAPRMTTTERLNMPKTPSDGLLVYDTNTHSYWYFKNGTWNEFAGGGTLWNRCGTNTFLSNAGDHLGIGTSTPVSPFESRQAVSSVPASISFSVNPLNAMFHSLVNPLSGSMDTCLVTSLYSNFDIPSAGTVFFPHSVAAGATFEARNKGTAMLNSLQGLNVRACQTGSGNLNRVTGIDNLAFIYMSTDTLQRTYDPMDWNIYDPGYVRGISSSGGISLESPTYIPSLVGINNRTQCLNTQPGSNSLGNIYGIYNSVELVSGTSGGTTNIDNVYGEYIIITTNGDTLQHDYGDFYGEYIIIGQMAGDTLQATHRSYALYIDYDPGTMTSINQTTYSIYINQDTTGNSSNYSFYSTGGWNYLAGNTGIGTNTPENKLDVSGDIRIEGTGKMKFGGTGAGDADVSLYRNGPGELKTDNVFSASSVNVSKINLIPGPSPGSPAEGDMYYDATLHKLRVWNGSEWNDCW